MEWHNNSVPRYIPGGWEGCKQEQGRIYSGETRKSLDVVQLLSCVWLFAPPWTAAHQASLSFTVSWSLLKLMSWSQWSHPNISSSVIPFSFCPQSSPASGSFPMSWLFISDDQNTGASVSVLPMNIHDQFPLRLTGLTSLVFSSPTVQRHQFFGTLPSLWSSSHKHTWPLERHSLDYMDLCQQSDVSAF